MALKTLCLLLSALLAPAGAQVVVGGSRTVPGVIRVDVDLVDVLCSVRDKKGTWAQGLTRDDFEVREDGKPRPLSHFSADSDSLVPPEYQRRVIDAYAGPKHVVNVPGANHDTPASQATPEGWRTGLEWLWGQVGK